MTRTRIEAVLSPEANEYRNSLSAKAREKVNRAIEQIELEAIGGGWFHSPAPPEFEIPDARIYIGHPALIFLYVVVDDGAHVLIVSIDPDTDP